MSKLKRLTPEQLMAAAKYLESTGQLAELMACIALERNVDTANEVWVEHYSDGCCEVTLSETLVDQTQSWAEAEWFCRGSDLIERIDDQIVAMSYWYVNR